MDYLASTVAPIVQALTSLAAVVGIFLLWYQIKSTNAWNRANAQHTLLSNLPSQQLEIEVWSLVESLKKDGKVLTEEAAEEIYNGVENWVRVKTFLNKFEQLCAAINAKSLEESYAYSVHGAKVVDAFKTFEAYINYARKRAEDQTIYLELERVATRWARKTQEESAKIRAEVQALVEARGVEPTV